MWAIFTRLLLAAFLLLAYGQCRGQQQTCNGALGDPVIDEDFGSGPNPGPQLPLGTTNMQYVSSSCPNDGQYTILNALVDSNNCHPYTWFNVPADHTGNKNGYMMLVNASYQPSIFFTSQANGLCPNTTYEFSAYILNLNYISLITINYSQPNITFTIQTGGGVILATDTTGTIPPTTYNQGPTWVKYGVYFTTPADVSNITLVMTNNAPGGNGNDFMMDDITFRACGPIIEEGFSSLGGTKTKSVCQGSNASYVLKTQVVGSNSPVYQWQASSTTSLWTDIAGATSDSLVVSLANAQPNTYQYRLGVANGSSITDVGCRVYSDPLTVTVNPLPVIPAFANQLVCEGDPLQLNATGGANYTWIGPNMSPTNQNPLVITNVTTANAGTYTVTAVSDSGCMGPSVNVNVRVIPKVVAAVKDTSLSLCAGESAQLLASGGLYYKWTPSAGLSNDTIADPVATPALTTRYTVAVSNGGCIDSSKTVAVTVNQYPVANAGKEIFMFEGQSTKLEGAVTGSNITSIYWTPATFLNDPTSLTPTATPTDNITYTLTAISATCGSSTSSVFVRVYQNVIIPNTFSPNNDGINDLWDIKSLNTYPGSTLQVFDRYGKQVFQSTGYSVPWDGTYNGNPLPQGTYYYVIDLKIGTPRISGWLLLVR
jgi:gliding motility-associated-like protein